MTTMIESAKTNGELSLIFVNYRSVFHLSRALRSLWQDLFFLEGVEVIVVNQDESERKAIAALSRQWGFRLIERENQGFASGANAGAIVARGKYLAFLNPDMRYCSGSLRDGIIAFQKDERVGIAGATLLDGSGMPERWSKGRALTFFRLIAGNIFPSMFSRARALIDWVSGGALFIPKDLFQTLRGFDEGFFLYFEDMDLCDRARKEHFTIQPLSSLRFFHQGGQSFKSKQTQKEYYFASQKRYFRKQRPFWEHELLSLLQHILVW